MKKILIMLVLAPMLLFINNKIYAQGEAAVTFLLLAPDSRAGGIGESGAGLADNSAAIFWNPAGIAFLTGSEASITHSNWLPQFGLDDLFYDYLTYRQYVEEISGSVTASITYMNFGEFIRTGEGGPEAIGKFRSFDAALTLGYSTKLHPDWGLGMNFRLIHSRLSDKPTAGEQGSGVATSVSFDIAGMWRPGDLNLPLIGDFSNRLSIGANLSNIGPKIYYIDQDQADPIPTNFRLGFAFRLMEDDYNSLTFTTDFSKLLVDRADSASQRADFYEAIFTAWFDDDFNTEMRDVVTSMGLEYWYGGDDFKFALRTGFFYEDPSYGNRKFVTIGAGIRYDLYGFDFSYITTDLFPDGENHPLSDTLRFTLSIGWGATTPTQGKGFPRGI
ncbi:MAG: type IX secretion system outer membrane channel protein PorV [Ignavibacteriae bacterium]|nr:type IX secretion system outer membrane channel protein PorV [Ignavibacteriota bacterium]MCB9207110.1 type IX secretion system outer membrane channel protein PorV [Ignavibacteriales bacterium]MCB9209967.1 type IX secretion system outer membrane channel protein PorV [Ignavibacteriales bacterium]MCB9218648.1 type IX secretion system outer membrane channel protein PorV [Ignavibacteriales bacterium]MCB9259346.1 type IX secretion system outer membrane channel protein PorV [Ignavibacteriales bacte